MKAPYKLQECGHTFCFDCLKDSVKYNISDATTYPLKCPECMAKIWIGDLETLVEESDWSKVLVVSINNVVMKNSHMYTYCFTPGCKNIAQIHNYSYIRC